MIHAKKQEIWEALYAVEGSAILSALRLLSAPVLVLLDNFETFNIQRTSHLLLFFTPNSLTAPANAPTFNPPPSTENILSSSSSTGC
jgi:hypothetical protein